MACAGMLVPGQAINCRRVQPRHKNERCHMSVAHNATETPAPQTCPACRQPWPTRPPLTRCAPYDEQLSSILEWLDVAHQAICQAKAAVEEEAMP
jgi:hypothetical protein